MLRVRGRRAWRDESGATLIIVAILIVILLGFVGLAIDSGRLYQERRELHNGADAAALAVASSCAAMLPDECSEAAEMPTAEEYAALNAHDGFAGVDELDIRNDIASSDPDYQTVYVETHTIEPDGTEESDPWLIQVVGAGSTRVEARATAKYGVPESLHVIPLVASTCEFTPEMMEQLSLPNVDEVAGEIWIHGGNPESEANECGAHPGFDQDEDGLLAGGFGWLQSERGCAMTIQSGEWYPEKAGVAVPQDCRQILLDAAANQGTILIPVFNDVWKIGGAEGDPDLPPECGDPERDDLFCPTGAGRYYIFGFAAFKVKAFRFPGLVGGDTRAPCTSDSFCIEGWFTEFQASIGDFGDPSGGNYGVTLVKLIE